MSLTTSTRVKTILAIPAGVTFHDNAVAQAVAYANDKVLQAIGQPGGLVATTRTDYPDVYSAQQRDVLLDRSPVVSMIAVTNASSAVLPADYRVMDEEGIVRLKGSLATWSDVSDDVVITYLHGYTDATVPSELVSCADMIAVHNMQQSPNFGKKRVRNSSYGFEVDQLVMPEAASQVLAGFTDVHHT